jgi:hypothetical protein
MKKWGDWAVEHIEKGRRNPQGNLLSAILRYRLTTPHPITEAESDGVPFTPIWWWWNHDADEYVMTLWDTEAGKDGPQMLSFGTSDPAGTFGRPAKMIVPESTRVAIRKLLDNK